MASKRPNKKPAGKRDSPRAAGPRRTYLEAQAAAHGFKDGQAYLNHLIDEDRRRAEVERRAFEKFVAEGDKGPWTPVDNEWLAERLDRVRHAARGRRRAG